MWKCWYLFVLMHFWDLLASSVLHKSWLIMILLMRNSEPEGPREGASGTGPGAPKDARGACSLNCSQWSIWGRALSLNCSQWSIWQMDPFFTKNDHFFNNTWRVHKGTPQERVNWSQTQQMFHWIQFSDWPFLKCFTGYSFGSLPPAKKKHFRILNNHPKVCLHTHTYTPHSHASLTQRVVPT